MSKGEEEYLLKNTIEEERFRIRKIVRKLGSKISGLMITCGFLMFVSGVYILTTPQDPNLSVRLKIIFTCALGFLGGLNVLGGLLLLLGED
jgi:hypothetical protein